MARMKPADNWFWNRDKAIALSELDEEVEDISKRVTAGYGLEMDGNDVKLVAGGQSDTAQLPVGTPGGIAALDSGGRVPAGQLPSYVDDILEFESVSAFPEEGESGKIYLALDTNKIYRWTGSQYLEVAEVEIKGISVNGTPISLDQHGVADVTVPTDLNQLADSNNLIPDALSDLTNDIPNATETAAGWMSATDKAKVDAIEAPIPTANWAVWCDDYFAYPYKMLVFLHLDEAPVAGETTILDPSGTYQVTVTEAYSAEGGWGDTIFTSAADAPWHSIRSSIPYIEFRDPLPALPVKEHPSNVTYDYEGPMDYWFTNCTKLATVDGFSITGLSSTGNAVFLGCSALQNIELPNDFKIVGCQTFSGCTNLALTSLPESVEYIDHAAFRNCQRLALTKFPESLLGLNDWSKITGMSVTTSGPFEGCTGLVNIVFPKRVEHLGAAAFRNCTGLVSVTFEGKPIQMSYTEGRGRIFEGCTNLTDIYVPWSEGAVAGARWGATNSTVHYNYHTVMSTELASASDNGLMSSSDFTKLAGMPPIAVVSALPSTPDANTVYIVTGAS